MMNTNDKTRKIVRPISSEPVMVDEIDLGLTNVQTRRVSEPIPVEPLMPHPEPVPPPPAPEEGHTVLRRRSSSSMQNVPAEPLAEKSITSSEIGWVVGWIVATTGPMKGQAFPLGIGQNQVGRDSSNRVCLPDDMGISRKGHVIITYSRRHNSFDVRLGSEGSGEADINGKPLRDSTPLNRGDLLFLSEDTTLIFIPLCGENFAWE